MRLPQDTDLIIVAPATAHLVARMAQGLADDVLTALLLARTAPVLIAPAMNDEMYARPDAGESRAPPRPGDSSWDRRWVRWRRDPPSGRAA